MAKPQNRSSQTTDREAKPSRVKGQKRDLPRVFAAEPEWKREKKEEVSSDDSSYGPYCALHSSRTHDMIECHEIKKMAEDHQKEWRRHRPGEGRKEEGRGGGCAGQRGGPREPFR